MSEIAALPHNEIAVIPHNFEAEQSLLGALFMNNELSDRVSAFLEPRHFYDPLHGRIYGDILKLTEDGHPATPVTLRPFFESDPDLEAKGGVSYLARLAAGAGSLINVESYARAIHALAVRRELLRVGQEIHSRARVVRMDDPPERQIEDAEKALYEAAERGRYEGGLQEIRQGLASAMDMARQAMESDRGVSGLSTGLIDLDDKLGGLQKSDLIIIAGRPSMGKTGLALTIAANAAAAWKGKPREDGKMESEEGAIVGFFSLEMSAEQLAMRLLAHSAKLPSNKIRQGKIGEEELQKLASACQDLTPMPLYIDETGALSLSALLARARRMKRQSGLDLVVADYIQLMSPDGRRHADRRVQELGEITQGLKALAKELDIPVVALSQLSRAVELREDKRPQLSDLRESGAIEQDADVVLFIYREEYYLQNKEPKDDEKKRLAWLDRMEDVAGLAEIIISKQRHGPIGSVKMRFEAETTSFYDHAPGDRLPDQTGD